MSSAQQLHIPDKNICKSKISSAQQLHIPDKNIRKSNYNSEKKYLQVTYLVFSDVLSELPLRSRAPLPSQLMVCRRNQTE